MVAINIITSKEEQVDKIIDFLLAENLLFEVVTVKEVSRRGKSIHGNATAYLIIGITKALLFKHINKELKERFEGNDLTVYSVPVVDMDLDKQKELIVQTKSV